MNNHLEHPYLIASADWKHDSPNPYSADGLYSLRWSCFELMDADDDRFFHGTAANGLFGFRAGRRCERLHERVADFLRYECLWGRKVIACGPAGVDMDAFLRQALAETPSGPVVRAQDPRWVAHSTTLERWDAIRSCGELRSLACLRREGWCGVRGVGMEGLGEPADYAEHVTLGAYDGIAGEYVVASHNAGRIVTEEHLRYEPGVRLYFDAHLLIRDGLAARDGLHLLKVRDRLRLEPYLVATIGAGDIDPEGKVGKWTPCSFLAGATGFFHASR